MQIIDIIPSISQLYLSDIINNSSLTLNTCTKALSGINLNDVTVNLDNSYINLFSSVKENILIYIVINVFTTDSFYAVSNFSQEIFAFCPSHDYMYDRFLASSKRMIESVVNHQISINNANNSFNHSSLVHTNLNTLNTGCLNQTLYWFFLYAKSHLAYYIAFLYLLINYLFGSLFSLQLNRFALYLLLLILQAKPVLGANMVLANQLITAIGWFVYINLMAIYDLVFKNIQSKHVSQTLFTGRKMNFKFLGERLGLGIIFAFVINTGVLFSNSFYNSTISYLSLPYKIVAIFSSYIISTLASTGWLYATQRDKLGYRLNIIALSYFRSLCESIAFLSLSFANYIIWALLPQTRVTFITTFIVGLLSYFFFSFFQIRIEINLVSKFVYGFLYNFVFTSLSISSSGFFFWIDFLRMSLQLKVAFMLLTLMGIIVLPLEVYRFRRSRIVLGEEINNPTLIRNLIRRSNPNNIIRIFLIGMLHQLIVFFSFAIFTFLWLYLAGLTL